MPLIPWLYVAPSTPAPNDAKYIVQTANTDLSAEQALGDLATGPLRVTTGTGVVAAGPIDVSTEITGTVPTARLGSGVADGTTYLRGDNTWATPSGSGAPASVSYVTLGTDGTLTQERVLTAGSGISLTDAGAGSTLTVKAPRVIGITIDGGGSVITTGVKGFVRVPFAGTITKATLLSTDAAVTSGSIVIDVWKDTYAHYPPTVDDTITASAKPTLSTATASEDPTLTGWTTSVSVDDIFGFKVDSATTVTRVTLLLTVN